ncbi:MAG: Mrp/NBP35 family ATP-binding protein [Chloroflexi bacterium]|uniref:Iron-sulfur cluster carrier protein n=1 Tax=Candidatus Chlorohelix allophototropha TaxID=3003348 RepID=A0A8T7M3Q0_9CHLR|nr:Mrp/NBP35 family ATP-binding protein [Chloroflexota bacterium]WJW66005.1 Mrp/NBP35 family ATP-binding protein [Chloroflexota bacterium L227-S17]
MPIINDEIVLKALSTVQEPELGGDLVSRKMIRNLKIEGSNITFTIMLTTPACPLKDVMEKQSTAAIRSMVPDAGAIKINFDSDVRMNRQNPNGQQEQLLPMVKNIIAISSGKGGVGKSTVSVNLAVALAQDGARVGLLDADVYGPNIPMMMGSSEKPKQVSADKIGALEAHGVKMMSIGFLVPPGSSMTWRGPMVHGALQQLMREVEWGTLDYFIVDMPPGTGDAQLTMTQSVQLSGAVIVSTPQDVALGDAVRGIAMFQQMRVPILGIVENMSYFNCPHCGMRTEIFDHGKAEIEAKKRNIPFLGNIPIDTNIRIGGDNGVPIVVSEPDSAVAQAFKHAARQMAARISVLATRTLPVIKG